MQQELSIKIFDMLCKIKDIPIVIQVHKGRKKYKKFKGIINGVYNNIFTIVPIDETKITQSYSFTDLITKDIVLIGYA